MQAGGQLTTTTEIDNWRGGEVGLTGSNLMDRMKDHAERFGTEIIYDHIHSVELGKSPFLLKGDFEEYTCDALIIATGATAQYLDLDSKNGFIGKGVSACATCDGFFYKDQNVMAVGGGNTAVEEALYLSNIASHVILVHQRDSLRAEKILQAQLFLKKQEGKISIIWSHRVDNIIGDEEGVTSIQLKSNKNGSTQVVLAEGLFIAIGHVPNTEIFKNQLELKDGYIVIKSGLLGQATNIKGVFAAGGCCGSYL